MLIRYEERIIFKEIKIPRKVYNGRGFNSVQVKSFKRKTWYFLFIPIFRKDIQK